MKYILILLFCTTQLILAKICEQDDTIFIDCNQCFCGANGKDLGCTMLICPRNCKDGETLTAAQNDGCNECSCSEGRWKCGNKDCEAECYHGYTKINKNKGHSCNCNAGKWNCTKIDDCSH